MAVTISAVSNALTKVLLPYVEDAFPKATILLDQVKRNSTTTFINNTFFAPIRTSRHGGVHNLANDASQLTTGSASIGQASVNVKYMAATFDISKATIEATKTTKGAVENLLYFQAKTLAADFARNINRQMFSDGFGVVAEVAGSTSGTAITIQAPSSSDGDGRVLDLFGSVNGDINPNKYLSPGQVVGLGSASGSGTGTISSISGSTINFTGTISSAANAPIYILDADGAGAGTAELQGIRLALSSSTGTSTYAGVARNTTTWTPQFDSTLESLSLSRMEKTYLAAREYGMVGDRYAIFVNVSLYQKYGDLLTALRREVNTTELLGGWSGIAFQAGAGKVGVFLDYDTPDGEVEIINLDSWTLCQMTDLGWMEDPANNAGSLFRRVNYLTYQATMAWFANVLCLAPGANGRLAQKTK